MFKPKTSVNEYDSSMLPKNRKEVFFDVLKLHWGKFLMFGCLMLLFAFPIHFFAVAEDFYLMQAFPPNPTDEQIASALKALTTLNLIRNGVNVALIVVFSVGLAGMSRVIRQYCWGENVDFNHDFLLGIKQNGKQFALIALVAGIIAFICNYIIQMSSAFSGEIYQWLGIIPTALCAVFLIPIAGYSLAACACYENKLRHNLKIGRVCYFKNLWKTLLACICCLAAFIPQTLSGFSGQAVIICHCAGRLASTLMIPEIMLGWYLFAFGRLDEAVNKKLHPELVGKGIYKPAAEEIIEEKSSLEE